MNILPISQWSDLEIILLFGKGRSKNIYWHLGPIISSIYINNTELNFMGSTVISVKNYAELEKRINEVQSR